MLLSILVCTKNFNNFSKKINSRKMSHFRNILVYVKKSKLNYLLKKYPESIKNSSEYRVLNDSMLAQQFSCDKFINFLKSNLNADQNIDFFYDDFEEYSHIEDFAFAKNTNYDLVFSLGGDGTFMRSLNFIHSCEQLVIGLNSGDKYSHGFYCSLDLMNKKYEDKIKQVLENKYQHKYLNKLNVVIEENNNLNANIYRYNRSSIMPEHQKNPEYQNKTRNYSFINDLYYGEKFMGRISKYNLEADDGKKAYLLKSSGLIVSTCK